MSPLPPGNQWIDILVSHHSDSQEALDPLSLCFEALTGGVKRRHLDKILKLRGPVVLALGRTFYSADHLFSFIFSPLPDEWLSDGMTEAIFTVSVWLVSSHKLS